MEGGSSQPLLWKEVQKQAIIKDTPEELHNQQFPDRICGTEGCGFSDERSRVVDSHARSVATRKLSIAIVLCLVFIAVEVAGGLISNSLAILTDAAHLLSDVAGFAISLFAIWAGSWEATPRQSYGYFRLEILGALVSIQLIWLLTGIIVYEAIYRLVNSSQSIDGRLMFIVASFGLCVNIAMAFLLGHDGHSHGHTHGHGHRQGHRDGHWHGHSEHSKNSKYNASSDQDEHHDFQDQDHEHEHGHVHGRKDADHNHDHEHSHDHDHDHYQRVDHLPGAVEEPRYSLSEGGQRESYQVDIDIGSEDSHQKEHATPGNINVKGAFLHVFGDLIQSVGVMIGGAIIWAKPEWKVVDLICTLLFSLLVLGTTIKMLRDIVEILMESTPREIDVKGLEKGLCDIPGVIAIHELHIWAITMGKTSLACHVTIVPDADADAVLQKVLGYCERVFNISHVTVQIERHRGTS